MSTRYNKINFLTVLSVLIPAVFVNKLTFLMIAIVILYKASYLYEVNQKYFVIAAFISAITSMIMINNVTNYINTAICCILATLAYIMVVQSNVIKRNTAECVLISLIALNIIAGLLNTGYIVKSVKLYNDSKATSVLESSDQLLNTRTIDNILLELNEVDTTENNIYNILNCIKDDKEYYSDVEDDSSFTKTSVAIKFMNNMDENRKHTSEDLKDTDLVNKYIHMYEAGNK